MLVIVVAAWGLTWPVNKVLLESLSPLWMAALRAAIATAALFAISIAGRRLVVPRRADMPVVLSITLLHMVGFVVLANVGLELVSTGRAVVLAYTTPLWVTPAARIFLKERLTPRRVIGVLTGIAGLAVLFNPLAFASSSVPTVPWDARLVALLLYSAVVGAALAYWATAVASLDLPAITTSLGLLATPVLSIVIATLWLGEAVTLSLAVAVLLVLGGIALGTTGARGARHEESPRLPHVISARQVKEPT